MEKRVSRTFINHFVSLVILKLKCKSAVHSISLRTPNPPLSSPTSSGLTKRLYLPRVLISTSDLKFAAAAPLEVIRDITMPHDRERQRRPVRQAQSTPMGSAALPQVTGPVKLQFRVQDGAVPDKDRPLVTRRATCRVSRPAATAR